MNDELTVIRSCSKLEYDNIKNAQEAVAILLKNNRRMDAALKAYRKISEINKSILLGENTYQVEDVAEAISAYLFRMRKYLDNTETYITREFGSSSDLYDIFKKATNKSYDEHIEYAIVYGLRNADQHCDNIVTGISTGIDKTGAHYIQAIAKCSTLLAVFTKWKKKEKEYLEERESIDLFACICLAHKCLMNIQQEFLNYFFSAKLYDDCISIVSASNEFINARESLMFLCQNEELRREFWQRPQQKLNTERWMVRQCIELLSLHIRGNVGIAVILYYGEQIYKGFDKFAIRLSDEQSKCIEIGNLINIDGVMYRCESISLELTNNTLVVIALNVNFSKNKEYNVTERFMRSVKTLNGET